MAKEAPKVPKPEIPKWVMTYSDMVSLLVTFFIMLMTWSSLEKEMYSKMMGSVAGAFGSISDPGTRKREAIRDPPPTVKNRIAEEGMRNPRKDLLDVEETAKMMVQKAVGDKIEFKQTEQGLRVVVRSDTQFDAGSDFLGEGARSSLRALADVLRSHDYEAILVGHAWEETLPGREEVDALDIASRRAVAAAEFLRVTGKVPEHLLKVASRGDAEPVITDDPARGGENRRVDVLILPRQQEEDEENG